MTTNQRVTDAVTRYREAEQMLKAASATYQAATKALDLATSAVDLARLQHRDAGEALLIAATADLPTTAGPAS